MALEYDYKFLTEPDDALTCRICLKVAEESIQHEDCGKLFCEKCIWKYGVRKPCPYCRMEQPSYFRDNKSELRIIELNSAIATYVS